ncbi:hypothetical protein BDP55DRAFT_139958 [Colletotrichum godetiae]|uniref:Transmembrane protein n=1 Tax=Colletotrichum godetiae TaxID=1209918 RepID=A0AAJ0AYL7_9PEZI|nr:uncharacterized protein BDP55DRAFT_139958 [Colletotrichum godetiae]KAK1700701.1 hypothetical protein BDP55DRAFT_139958 [Colletotrichum godetiae]
MLLCLVYASGESVLYWTENFLHSRPTCQRLYTYTYARNRTKKGTDGGGRKGVGWQGQGSIGGYGVRRGKGKGNGETEDLDKSMFSNSLSFLDDAGPPQGRFWKLVRRQRKGLVRWRKLFGEELHIKDKTRSESLVRALSCCFVLVFFLLFFLSLSPSPFWLLLLLSTLRERFLNNKPPQTKHCIESFCVCVPMYLAAFALFSIIYSFSGVFFQPYHHRCCRRLSPTRSENWIHQMFGFCLFSSGCSMAGVCLEGFYGGGKAREGKGRFCGRCSSIDRLCYISRVRSFLAEEIPNVERERERRGGVPSVS